jgi:hypothetical protein
MKFLAKLNRSSAIFIAALTCMILAGSMSAFAVRQKLTGKAVAGVTVITESQDSFLNSTSYQNLAGATATITVPADKVQLVQASFFAESSCTGEFGGNFCSLRILADGSEMSPSAFEAPIEYAFDGVNADDFREGHAMQRSILLGPGTHTIQVQVAVSNSFTGLFVDDWSLTITQYNNGK